MLAWILTLAGSYVVGQSLRNVWAAALAGVALGLVSGLVAGALTGALVGGIAAHVVGSATVQMLVGGVATLVFRARRIRSEQAESPGRVSGNRGSRMSRRRATR